MREENIIIWIEHYNQVQKPRNSLSDWLTYWHDLIFWSTCKLEQEHGMLMPWHPKWSARGIQMDLRTFLHPLLQLLEFFSHNSTTIIIEWRLFVSWLQISLEIVSILVLVVVEIEEKRQWHWNPNGEECLCSLFVKSSHVELLSRIPMAYYVTKLIQLQASTHQI